MNTPPTPLVTATFTPRSGAEHPMGTSLEWPLLVELLAQRAQCEDGRKRCENLLPNLNREEVEQRWSVVEPLSLLAAQGYRPPVGDLPPLGRTLRAASLGQVLTGPELRAVYDLLMATRQVSRFAEDFAERCPPLRQVRAQLYPLPNLIKAVETAVGPDGELLDEASPQLKKIREQKFSLRRRIEEQIRRLLRDSDVEAYLQDDFFTVRAERYVIPIRLDGRGRVQGSIVDTSDSGQTLFIEPAPIAPLNQQLLELELAEKLEILRIFRELSSAVAAELETLSIDYEQLVELDFLAAQAAYALDMGAHPITLADTPILQLIGARHPLVHSADGRPAVANNVGLEPEQKSLIISGPNAGGKTVVLKTVGLITLMAKAGLLVPANPDSVLFLYDRVFVEMGDAQSITASLSTFSGHLLGLKPIIETATERDLVLLDEIAVGTEPETGSAIAQAILEHLVGRGVTSLVTTHFDRLKGLAIKDQRFRNGSMEFSMATLKPTYKLIMDVPGQSYGLEVAEQLGLPGGLISRARDLRGRTASSLEEAVSQLMQARDQVRAEQQDLERRLLAAEAEKARWEQERALLDETRRKAAKNLAAKYEGEIASLKADFEVALDNIKRLFKEAEKGERAGVRQSLVEERQRATKTLEGVSDIVRELASDYGTKEKLPGRPMTPEEALPGRRVFVLPLKKEGQILKKAPDDTLEVQIGVAKLRLALRDLRALGPVEKTPTPVKPAAVKPGGAHGRNATKDVVASPNADGPPSGDGGVPFTPPSPTNSLDLRGLSSDEALTLAWRFIDQAILRGERSVILIHGHGTDRLKTALRGALQAESPYDLRFRPGEDAEGGNGVTVVKLGS